MNGMFRYGKGIAAALTLSAVAFVLKTAPQWLFPYVDPLPGHGEAGMLIDDYLTAPRASPPVREVLDAATTWKVAVVTNRPMVQPDEPLPFQATKPLSEQVVDAIYRSADTHFQFCDVVIPNNRRRGTCPVQNDKQPGIAFRHIEQSVSETFFPQLETLRQQSGSQDILIFIHGFNVRLPEAVARAAQVAEDMPFAGPVVVFSWNSQAKTLAYQQDEHSAERHFWSLAELLHGLRTNLAPSCKLHVVAHSMGNRVTLRAINALTGTIDPVGQPTDMFVRARLQSAANVSDVFAAIDSTRTSIVNGTHEIPQRFPIWASWRERNVSTAPLANLILAAPDVDAVEFRQLVGDIKQVCSGITVYASESDLALEASRRVHGGRYRAGDARANLDIEGITVIRVSVPGSNDLLGHSYYGSHPQVLDQLHQLTQPLRRITLGISAQRQ